MKNKVLSLFLTFFAIITVASGTIHAVKIKGEMRKKAPAAPVKPAPKPAPAPRPAVKPAPKPAPVANGGSYFLALELPSDTRQSIQNTQNFIRHRLPHHSTVYFTDHPEANLHITLQEIGIIDAKDRATVLPKIQRAMDEVAAAAKEFDIASLVRNATFEVWDGYLVYNLQPSNELTNFVDFIRQTLNKHGVRYKARMDFPNKGHISIGKFTDSKKQSELKNLFEARGRYAVRSPQCSRFRINKFVLKQSNAPQTPRVYTNRQSYTFSPRFVPAPRVAPPAPIAVEKEYQNAGVMLYTTKIEHGQPKVYVLIGLSQTSHSRNQWTDFGGGKEPHIDGDHPRRTAAREASEELIFFLDPATQFHNLMRLKHAHGRNFEPHKAGSITYNILHSRITHRDTYQYYNSRDRYVGYIVPIAYDSQYEKTFANRTTTRGLPHSWGEFTKVEWVSLRDIVDTLDRTTGDRGIVVGGRPLFSAFVRSLRIALPHLHTILSEKEAPAPRAPAPGLIGKAFWE